MKKIILSVFIVTFLSSCASVPISATQKKKDEEIRLAIRKKYNSEKWFDLHNVDIGVYNGKVNLTGLVYNYDAQDEAYRDAEDIAGKSNVSGAITVTYIGG